MNLIPVLRPCTLEELEKYGFEAETPPEWVSVMLKVNSKLEEFETNRYDMNYQDDVKVYMYMDEHNSQLIAVDDIAQDFKTESQYIMKDTPVYDELKKHALL